MASRITKRTLLILAVMALPAVYAGQPSWGADTAYRMVIMPKFVGASYYDAVEQGVNEAAKDINAAGGGAPGVKVQWIGPTTPSVDKQIEMIDSIIPTKPDLIAVAADDQAAIVPTLKKAQAAGIHVMSFDGDTNFREAFTNLVDYQAIGAAMTKSVADQAGEDAKVAIITTTLTAPNQNQWIEVIKKTAAEKYPKMQILGVWPAGEDTNKAYQTAQSLIQSRPTMNAIIVLGVPNVPGAAKAVDEAKMGGKIALVGNSMPSLMKKYIENGVAPQVFLWNPIDQGYLTVYTAYNLLQGKLKIGTPFTAGRLGAYTPEKDSLNLEVALPVLEFTKNNVDQFKF
jgi:rhamnose transport system substrate-binding protein